MSQSGKSLRKRGRSFCHTSMSTQHDVRWVRTHHRSQNTEAGQPPPHTLAIWHQESRHIPKTHSLPGLSTSTAWVRRMGHQLFRLRYSGCMRRKKMHTAKAQSTAFCAAVSHSTHATTLSARTQARPKVQQCTSECRG